MKICGRIPLHGDGSSWCVLPLGHMSLHETQEGSSFIRFTPGERVDDEMTAKDRRISMLDWDDKSAVDAAVKGVIAGEGANGVTCAARVIYAVLEVEHGSDVRAFRGVDASLQRLRKAGHIVLKRGPGGGWLIAEASK